MQSIRGMVEKARHSCLNKRRSSMRLESNSKFPQWKNNYKPNSQKLGHCTNCE